MKANPDTGYGEDQKISTDLVIPGSDKTMNICFDQGSEDFWVLEPGAKFNWGSERLGLPGPCNVTASPSYDYSASSDATTPVPAQYFQGYGGLSKIVLGDATFQDTMTFTSVAGQRSTIKGIPSALVNFVTVRVPDRSGQCELTDDLTYDAGILGTAPYQNSDDVRDN